MASKKPFYASTPAVPPKKLAVTPSMGKVETPGVFKPPTVPLHPGRTHGLGPQLRQPHPGSHGYGHVGKQRQGHYRTSGNPAAHWIGKKILKPPKVNA